MLSYLFFCFVLLPSCTDVMAEHFLKCISWKKLWRNIHMNMKVSKECGGCMMKNEKRVPPLCDQSMSIFFIRRNFKFSSWLHAPQLSSTIFLHWKTVESNNTSHQSILAWYAPWRPVTFMNHQGNFEANPLLSCRVNNESLLFVASQL